MSNGPWGGGNNNQPWGNGGGQPPFKRPGKDPMEEKLAAMQRQLQQKLNLQNNPLRGIGLAALAIGALWLSSGFYVVDSKEVGVVQRFGKFAGITQPGLRYHLPAPIETATKLGVLSVNTVEVGFRSGAPRSYNGNDEQLRREKLMLTGDQNIVEIGFDVQWKIDETHPEAFLFNVRGAEATIQPVAESVMREVIGKLPITDALAKQEQKIQIEETARTHIQKTLNDYGAGIRIVKVNLLKADPPAAVIDAFRDVKTAEQDKETTQNRARAYANEVVPKARGEAQKLINEAEAYKQAVLADAQGNAARFKSVATQYRTAPDITAKRLYIETMEAVLKDIPKVVLDGKATASGAVPYLPLPAVAAPKRAPEPETESEGAKQ